MANCPKVVVATLTWNQKKDTLECLKSIVSLDYPNFEVALVDNGSTDGTFEEVSTVFPSVDIIKNKDNLL